MAVRVRALILMVPPLPLPSVTAVRVAGVLPKLTAPLRAVILIVFAAAGSLPATVMPPVDELNVRDCKGEENVPVPAVVKSSVFVALIVRLSVPIMPELVRALLFITTEEAGLSKLFIAPVADTTTPVVSLIVTTLPNRPRPVTPFVVAPPIVNTAVEPELIVILPYPPVPLWVSRVPVINTPFVPVRVTVDPLVPLALVALMLKLAMFVVSTWSWPGVVSDRVPPPVGPFAEIV